MRRVWIAQCLCPKRHCIIAGAAVCDDDITQQIEALRSTLRAQADALIARKQVNPWCGLCEARRESWKFEARPTAFGTLEDALPFLRSAEAAQMSTRSRLGTQ